MSGHTLLLMRHAEAAGSGVGGDLARPLTPAGMAQAAAAGRAIAEAGHRIDLVLCSPARRTRETLAGLALPAETAVTVTEQIYNAGSDTLRQLVAVLEDQIHTVLIVGHAPGIPRLAFELSGPDSSAPAVQTLDGGFFPPATIATLSSTGLWTDLDLDASARLDDLRLGS